MKVVSAQKTGKIRAFKYFVRQFFTNSLKLSDYAPAMKVKEVLETKFSRALRILICI
jgi:hypothetical protein